MSDSLEERVKARDAALAARGHPESLSVPKAAKVIGVNYKTMLKLVKGGEVPATYLSQKLGHRIDRAELARFWVMGERS